MKLMFNQTVIKTFPATVAGEQSANDMYYAIKTNPKSACGRWSLVDNHGTTVAFHHIVKPFKV